MNVKTLTQFIAITVGLCLGLAVVASTSYRANVANNWEQYRCDPTVQSLAAFFKPSKDPRSAAQFAHDNWIFCQKEYVQDAIRLAAAPAKELAAATASTVSVTESAVGAVADVFFDLWNFCHEAYSSFMDSMMTASRQFQNMIVRLSNVVQQAHAAAMSIVMALLSLIITIVNSVQLTLIVVTIVVGIVIALEIILFFLLMPISGLIITVSALVSVVTVAVATAIVASDIAEMFAPGVCFAAGTGVLVKGGGARPIEEIGLGTVLADGGRVTAVHRFWSAEPCLDVRGVCVTRDHLVTHPDYPRRLIAARDYPGAKAAASGAWEWLRGGQRLYCLTTTTRRIPCAATDGTAVMFADWEEIQEEDDERLTAWHTEVWRFLNGPDSEPTAAAPVGEAGLAPDTLVAWQDWMGRRGWRRAADIEVGDRVYDRMGHVTTVVGRVTLEGDQSIDAVAIPSPEHGPQIVSAATWIQTGVAAWEPAGCFSRMDVHPVRWEHLYTESGEFLISGGWLVRDASEIGLANLHTLVEDIVLQP